MESKENFHRKYYEKPSVWSQPTQIYQKEVISDISNLIPKKTSSVLDVGCGNGLVLDSLPSSLKRVGIDISREALSQVTTSTVVGEIENLPFDDNSFDLVMCNDVLEHLQESSFDQACAEVGRVAAKAILITVPVCEDLNASLCLCPSCGELFHINHHQTSFQPAYLRQMLEKFGWLCDCQVLTGDVITPVPREIACINSLAGDRMFPIHEAVCPNCGEDISDPDYKSLSWRRRVASGLSRAFPERLPVMMRTEIVSLYKKQRSKKRPLSCNACWEYRPTEHEIIDRNRIDFTNENLFRADELYLYSILPQYINKNSDAGMGRHLSTGQLLLSFSNYSFDEKQSVLRLEGESKEKNVLRIFSYLEGAGYQKISEQSICGEFLIEQDFSPINFSGYGFLFAIEADSPISLTEACVSDAKHPIKLYDLRNSELRYLSLGDTSQIYLSLSIYNDFLIELPWMIAPDQLDKLKRQSIVQLKEEFEVERSIASFLVMLGNVFESDYAELSRRHFDFKDQLQQFVERTSIAETGLQQLQSKFDLLQDTGFVVAGLEKSLASLQHALNVHEEALKGMDQLQRSLNVHEEALKQLDSLGEALNVHEEALKQLDSFGEALNVHEEALKQLDSFGEALNVHEEALKGVDGLQRSLNVHEEALKQLDSFGEALNVHEEVLKGVDGLQRSLNVHEEALKQLDSFGEALNVHEEALKGVDSFKHDIVGVMGRVEGVERSNNIICNEHKSLSKCIEGKVGAFNDRIAALQEKIDSDYLDIRQDIGILRGSTHLHWQKIDDITTDYELIKENVECLASKVTFLDEHTTRSIDIFQRSITRHESQIIGLGVEIEAVKKRLELIELFFGIGVFRGLKHRFLKFVHRCGFCRTMPWKDYEEIILSMANMPKLDSEWEIRTAGKQTFLMICHDQDMDRRVLQQAKSLQDEGWEGIVVALSHSGESCFEKIDGIAIHRIGLNHIVPQCNAYWKMQKRARCIAGLPGKSFLHKLNDKLYHCQLKMEYHGKSIACPLPFSLAFKAAGMHYPADLVQAHDLPALSAALDLGEAWGAPVVYDAHELYYEQVAFSPKQKRMMRTHEKENIKRCSLTFTVNKSIAEEMASRYDCDEPNVLTNAVDAVEVEFKSDCDFRSYFEIDSSQTILLLQGGLVPNRNLENLVKSMAYIKSSGAVLVFMGGGPLLSKLKELAKKKKCDNRIYFKEAVPQEQVLLWASTADVGIIPYPAVDLNTKYCTPNKLFEYMQAGLPMLANDLPELNRYVKEAGFGVTTQMSSPKEIAVAIDGMVDSPEALEGFRANLLADREKYSWSEEKKKYTALVSQAVKFKTENELKADEK